jgi:hypothetical protein
MGEGVHLDSQPESLAPAARPWWITALFVFSLLGLLVAIPRDLFFPAYRDVEVWLGFELKGWTARLTAPFHWAIYAAGAWGFLKQRPWMWPWASVYVFYVAISHLVWSEVSPHGRGWPIGLLQALALSVIGVALCRARLLFQPVRPRA